MLFRADHISYCNDTSIVLWKYVIDFFDFIDRMINPREMIDMMTPF